MYADRKRAEDLIDMAVWIESLVMRVGKRLVVYALVVGIILAGPCSTVAYAEECKEPVAVTQPCSGVLLPPKAAESGLKCLKVEVPRLTLELDYLKKERTSFGNYHELILKAEKDRSAALQRQVEILLKKDTGQKWYEHPAFHFAMGFVTASAVTIGITYAVNND